MFILKGLGYKLNDREQVRAFKCNCNWIFILFDYETIDLIFQMWEGSMKVSSRLKFIDCLWLFVSEKITSEYKKEVGETLEIQRLFPINMHCLHAQAGVLPYYLLRNVRLLYMLLFLLWWLCCSTTTFLFIDCLYHSCFMTYYLVPSTLVFG